MSVYRFASSFKDKNHILRWLLMETQTASQPVGFCDHMSSAAFISHHDLGNTLVFKGKPQEVRKSLHPFHSDSGPCCRKEMKQKSSWFSPRQIYQYFWKWSALCDWDQYPRELSRADPPSMGLFSSQLNQPSWDKWAISTAGLADLLIHPASGKVLQLIHLR